MDKGKVLVTGANGFLGQHLVKAFLENSYSVIATGRGPSRTSFAGYAHYSYHSLDLNDEAGWEQLFAEKRPTSVIHTAAMTQADECELHREACFAANVRGTAMIVAIAARHAKFLVFVSTDFVFDGHVGNYKEEDQAHPVNWYGFTKVQAESFVREAAIPWAIVRTCLVYGHALSGTRSNIISWVKSKLESNEKIRVVDDQLRTPTHVEDLVNGILMILEKKARGVFHISGEDQLTPYDMAVMTAQHCGLDRDFIERVNASTFSQAAKRPLKTGFDIGKAKNILGFKPRRFQQALNAMYPPGKI